jgi:protoheme IX farnesyltransferase
MATTSAITLPSARDRSTSKLRDYYTLTKPEVNLLILMTTSAGYYLASHGDFRVVGLLNTLLGTVLVASGTATLNQWMERVWDGQMRRTATRPIPSGRVHAREALLLGISLSVVGGLYLLIEVNGLSALLAIATLLSYLLVYTP